MRRRPLKALAIAVALVGASLQIAGCPCVDCTQCEHSGYGFCGGGGESCFSCGTCPTLCPGFCPGKPNGGAAPAVSCPGFCPNDAGTLAAPCPGFCANDAGTFATPCDGGSS